MAISFWNKSKNNLIKNFKIEQTNENSIKPALNVNQTCF